ncbi:MAG: transcription elongation factor GreA [Faecalibacterium sp.]|jgi:transcription elongation factor GreA|nr:transcription elongation factor GreA [Faecalibacterium sp.]
MASNEVVMSAAGLKAAQDELEYLKTVRRKELAEEIKEARSHGDLSENSEYDEAKNTQGLVENRISELEQMLKNVKVIDESELNMDSIAVGMHVTIQEKGASAEEYDVVGRTEADPLNGKISDESPVGSALLGKGVGDAAEVLLPNGRTVTYKIVKIERSK